LPFASPVFSKSAFYMHKPQLNRLPNPARLLGDSGFGRPC